MTQITDIKQLAMNYSTYGTKPRRRRASLLDAASALASLGVGGGGGNDQEGPSTALPAPPRAEEMMIQEEEDDDRQNEDQQLSMSATTGLTVPVSSLRGDVPMTFPEKLMDVLSNPSISSIISWLPHGRGFVILHKRRFASEVMPLYFKQSKFTSFTRKLNRWGFSRVQAGPEVGAYYHQYFQRGNHLLCMQMHCQAINSCSTKKTSSVSRKSSSTRSSELSSPGSSPPPQDHDGTSKDSSKEGPESMASFDAVLKMQRRLLVQARAEESLRGNSSSITGPTEGFEEVFNRQQRLLRANSGGLNETSGRRTSGPRDFFVSGRREASRFVETNPTAETFRRQSDPRDCLVQDTRFEGIVRTDETLRRPSNPRDYPALQRSGVRLNGVDRTAASLAVEEIGRPADPRDYLTTQWPGARFDEMDLTDETLRRPSDPRDYLKPRRFGCRLNEIDQTTESLAMLEETRRPSDPRDYLVDLAADTLRRPSDPRDILLRQQPSGMDASEISPLSQRLMLGQSSRRRHHRLIIESALNALGQHKEQPSVIPGDISDGRAQSLAEVHLAMQERLRRLREHNRSVEDAIKGYNCSVEDALKGERRSPDFSQVDVARLRREIGQGPQGSPAGAYGSRPGQRSKGTGSSPRGGRAAAA